MVSGGGAWSRVIMQMVKGLFIGLEVRGCHVDPMGWARPGGEQ